MSHIPIFCLILLIVEKRTNIWWAHYSFTYLDCMRLQSCVKYVGFKPHRQQWIVGRNLHWEAMKAFAWSVSHYMNGLKSYNPWTFMLHANALDVVFYLQVYHCLMFQMRQCVWYHAWEFPEQESYALQEFITFSTWKTSKNNPKVTMFNLIGSYLVQVVLNTSILTRSFDWLFKIWATIFW